MYSKKNVFVSVITVLTMITLAGMLCISVYCLMPYVSGTLQTMILSFSCSAVAFLLINLIVYFIAKIKTRKNSLVNADQKVKVSECILFFILSAFNFLIRLLPTVIFNITDNTYFNLSLSMQRSMQIIEKVTQQTEWLKEPLAYGYSRFLSILFAVLGTKQPILLFGNLVLLFVFVLFLYLLMRKMSGRVAALVALATCYLVPSLLFSAFDVNQQILFAVLILGALLICTRFSRLSKEIELSEQRTGGFAVSVGLGLLLGFASMTDVSGILFAVLIFALLLSYKKGNWGYVLMSFLSMLLMIALCVYDYINVTKISIFEFANAYLAEWIPNRPSFPLFEQTIRGNMEELFFFDGMTFSKGFMDFVIRADYQVLLVLLLATLLGGIFYMKKRSRTSFMIYLSIIIVCVLSVFRIGNGKYHLLFMSLVLILFSQYLKNLYEFFVWNEKAEQQEINEDGISGMEYIENPLPLPPKHTPKCLDFDNEVDDNKFEFDIEIDHENDDWDV